MKFSEGRIALGALKSQAYYDRASHGHGPSATLPTHTHGSGSLEADEKASSHEDDKLPATLPHEIV